MAEERTTESQLWLQTKRNAGVKRMANREKSLKA